MILETNRFRELLRETRELSLIAQQQKYNLQNEDSLRDYEFWAPYVMNHPSAINFVGYKIFMIDMMSILLVLKDEENNKDRYYVPASQVKKMYEEMRDNTQPETCNQPLLNLQSPQQQNDVYSSQENVINFSQYKMRKR